MSPLIYAIDFGTSNSLVAAADARSALPAVALDPKAKDPTVLQSIFYTPRPGTWFFGAEAVEEYSLHSAEGRLLRSIKKYLPDASFGGTNIHNKFYNLTELIAIFFRHLRAKANAHYDQDVTAVVLGRPAVFAHEDDADRLAEQRLKTAASLAGFKDVHFCPEPVAAAYAFRHELHTRRTVLIADFGGGTSDFTVLSMGPEEFKDSDILATHGTPIAGDRFDGAIMKSMIAQHFGSEVVYRLPMGKNELKLPQSLINRLCSAPDISLLARGDIMHLLKEAQRWTVTPDDARRMDRLFVLVEEHLGYKLFKTIERNKIELSTAEAARLVFDHPGIELEVPLPRSGFVDASAELVMAITAALDETLRRAGVQPAAVDVVCCTGGTARIPALGAALASRFGAEKLWQYSHFHSVVHGLAEKGRSLLRG